MLKATAGTDGPLTFNATVGGLPIYLDNHSIIGLAKGDPSRRRRFVAAFHNGADLLFSITNAVELTGPQGHSADLIKVFLDEIGPHWFPVELNPYLVTQRELEGLTGGDACISGYFIKQYFAARTSDYSPGSGKVIDLSGDFFRLGAVLDWLQPQRDTIQRGTRELDGALIEKINAYRAEFERDPKSLDRTFPSLPFTPSRAATFTYVNLIRSLVLDAKAYQLKKGDGVDYCHAIIGSTFASFATLDKHWKRRVESLPQPNGLARIYYAPELERLLADVERGLEQLRIARGAAPI